MPAEDDAPRVTPFRIAVAQADLDDLRDRLDRTRLPEAATVAGWEQGPPCDVLADLLRSWRAHDWRASEERLNRLPHHTTEIDGLDLHFLHVRSPEPDAFPVILTHGWPGSFLEFERVIGPLTDPVRHGGSAEQAFHVVVPSLPGYGFSARPTEAGWGVERIARAWRTLMDRLGYARYGAQGGDWGLLVTTAMATVPTGPDGAPGPIAIHLSPPPAGPDPDHVDDLTAAEQSAVADMQHYASDGLGYATQMRTRPQTIGYGLTDSPAALAAWIVEKLQGWTDNDGDVDAVLGRDAILDLLSLYWLTNTAASAARLYWESSPSPDEMAGGGRPPAVTTPTGAMVMPADHGRPSRRWAERRFTDIRRWTALDRGGHFPAWEVPELYVAELRAFFDHVRWTTS